MKVWLWIVSLSACFAAGTSVKCLTCSSKDEASCKGDAKQCDGHITKCVAGRAQMTNSKGFSVQFTRMCAEEYMCDQKYAATSDDMVIYVVSSCCQTDLCRPDFPKIPPKNNTKNGYFCPSCFKQGSGECTPKRKMECTGLETKCVGYSGMLYSEEDFPMGSFHGCGTPSSCPKKASTASSYHVGPKMSCSKPTRHP